jgi:hypothetical protein
MASSSSDHHTCRARFSLDNVIEMLQTEGSDIEEGDMSNSDNDYAPESCDKTETCREVNDHNTQCQVREPADVDI